MFAFVFAVCVAIEEIVCIVVACEDLTTVVGSRLAGIRMLSTMHTAFNSANLFLLITKYQLRISCMSATHVAQGAHEGDELLSRDVTFVR